MNSFNNNGVARKNLQKSRIANATGSQKNSKGATSANKGKAVFLPGNMKWLSSVAVPVLFALYAFFMLAFRNADYLYACQERSIFIFDSSFLDMMLQQPGGFLMWLGCFFTQFFYTPWLGSLFLIVMWAVIYFLTIRTFRISSPFHSVGLIIPAALLCSVIGIGYWLYYVKSSGYWFTGSISIMLMFAALLLYSRIGNRWVRLAWMAVWAIGGYVVFGWYALLGVVCMCVGEGRFARERANGDDAADGGMKLLAYIVGALLVIGVPVVAYQCYSKMNFNLAWLAALPVFQVDGYVSYLHEIPFIIVAVVSVLLCLIPMKTKWEDIRRTSAAEVGILFLNSFIAIMIAVFVLSWNFDDENFHAELRTYKAIDEGRWNDALDEVGSMKTAPTREIVILRNIALMNEGKLGSSMFKYDNKSIPPATDDSLQVHMVQTNGPLTYLNYGRTNFATRWCIENSVEHGFNIDSYKILLRCALVNGEYDLAQKYIDIMKKTLYYRDWAEKYEAVNGDSIKISKLPGMESVHELHNNFRSILDGDEGLIEIYLLGYFSHTHNKDSKLLTDVTTAYSLISKDIQLFWPQFFLYASLHAKEQMPIHYQEAAFLYGNLEHQVDISGMPFDQELVVNRYNSFQQMSQSYLRQGMTSEQVGEAMRPMYGDTFWWFYFFARNIQSY